MDRYISVFLVNSILSACDFLYLVHSEFHMQEEMVTYFFAKEMWKFSVFKT